MSGSRKVSYVVSIWHQPHHDDVSVWRGYLETAAGQRFDFGTLTELNRLLCELGGWMDPPIPETTLQAGSELPKPEL